jgi:hypothetical protein
MFRREMPLFRNLISVKDNSVTLCETVPMQRRVVKGIVSYSIFIALVGLNFAFLGIGFDPVAWELSVNL